MTTIEFSQEKEIDLIEKILLPGGLAKQNRSDFYKTSSNSNKTNVEVLGVTRYLFMSSDPNTLLKVVKIRVGESLSEMQMLINKLLPESVKNSKDF